MDDIIIRFIDLYNYLKKEKIIRNSSDLAKNIGVSISLITEIKKGRSSLGTKIIQNLVKMYGLNTEWLFTGKGEMLKNTETLENGKSKNVKSIVGIKAIGSGTAIQGSGNTIVDSNSENLKNCIEIIRKQQDQMGMQQEQMGELISIIKAK